MVLDDYREMAYKLIDPFARRYPWSPNSLSILSLFFALGAAIVINLDDELGDIVLVLAGCFIFLNAVCDGMDGQVARFRKITSKKGDLIDHTFDRVADLTILIGISFSVYCEMWIGILAISTVMMVSYLGTQSQALGIGRNLKGLLGRADRLALLIFVPLIQYIAMTTLDTGDIHGYQLLEWLLLFFILASTITCLQRFRVIWKAL